MKNKALLFILFISLIFGSFGQNVFAEDVLQAETAKMEFAAAIKYSLENNNNIRAMRKNLSATERDIGIERSVIMPKIRFYENFAATNNPTDALSYRLNQARATAHDLEVDTLNHPDSVTNFLTSGLLEQTIYNRKAFIELKMAKKEYSASGYFYLRKQEELVNKVAQAYLAISTDKELIKVAELAVHDAKEHLKTAEAKNKGNSNPSTDMLRAKTGVEENEQKLTTAQRNLAVAMRKLGLLLGLETPVDISDAIPEIKLQDINYYKDFAVYRNDVKATEIKVQNAKMNIQAAQSDWYPTFNAMASYSLYNSNYPFGAQGNNYTVGAFFKWDVFDGNKRKYEILKAKDKEIEAKEYLEGLRKSVDFSVFETYSNVEEHKKNLEFALSSKKAAEEDVKLIEKQWLNSEVHFVEVTDAQIHLNAARENVVRCQFDLSEDLFNLIYESGIIAQELGLQ